MTFEEAKEQLNELFTEPNPSGYSIGDFDPEFIGSVEDLEEIFDKLQATYAPKVKMTKAQFDWIYKNQDLDIENLLSARWETPTIAEKGYTDSVRQIREISDETLVMAWLHPELIEVVE